MKSSGLEHGRVNRRAVHGNNDCAFEPHNSHVVVSLEKALQGSFPCLIAGLGRNVITPKQF